MRPRVCVAYAEQQRRTPSPTGRFPPNGHDVTSPLAGDFPDPATIPALGDHRLPVRFSAETPSVARPPKPRRRRTGLVLGTIAAGVLIAAAGLTQWSANVGYDDAALRVDDARRTVTAQNAQAEHATAALTDSTDAGHVILDAGAAPLPVPEDAVAALADAVAEGEEVGAAVEEVMATELPGRVDKPAWFWELFAATAELSSDEHDLNALAGRLDSASGDASAATRAVQESGVAVITETGAAAAPFEAAHISARNDAVIALRDAATRAAGVSSVDDASAAIYAALQAAGAQVVATENEELAEKSGPLLNARLEIEAFARSLAPGVLLDFDWAPVVSGAGYNGSMGGYTTWWWGPSGRATIELSNSVAEQWPAARSRALIAHEVGHAISVKCQSMYDASTQDSIEKWATAWAISMGYTDDANGVWAYGYPPQSYIDAAAGCR